MEMLGEATSGLITPSSRGVFSHQSTSTLLLPSPSASAEEESSSSSLDEIPVVTHTSEPGLDEPPALCDSVRATRSH